MPTNAPSGPKPRRPFVPAITAVTQNTAIGSSSMIQSSTFSIVRKPMSTASPTVRSGVSRASRSASPNTSAMIATCSTLPWSLSGPSRLRGKTSMKPLPKTAPPPFASAPPIAAPTPGASTFARTSPIAMATVVLEIRIHASRPASFAPACACSTARRIAKSTSGGASAPSSRRTSFAGRFRKWASGPSASPVPMPSAIAPAIRSANGIRNHHATSRSVPEPASPMVAGVVMAKQDTECAPGSTTRAHTGLRPARNGVL